ncbi:histidine phosphatase family protein [Acinetobacter sp. ANC 4178]|uniref:histidine phosphatase family protein n=1 Tax=Acinetobacter sp. ANC 4178 TaxID=2529839 RepID=UPI00103ED937|nr:histidine phosphatase family protein [Acinetobacter sp. ANC 4178]TCB66426.1 histidine phosphatase family protein [Acinetobacter sp. ANC 4178]
MHLKIDLLRHGESELSHTLRGSLDDALTAKGWQQMLSSIGQSQTLPQQWDVVFSSPLQRCSMFAQHFVKEQDIPLILDKNLQEMHFGDWEGQSIQQLYEQFPETLADFWQKPTQTTLPNAETMQQFHLRVSTAITDIQQQMQLNGWQSALVVTHGGVIKLLKCMVLQQPLDDVLKMSAELGQLNSFRWDAATQMLALKELT